jgi:hypothetical protein
MRVQSHDRRWSCGAERTSPIAAVSLVPVAALVPVCTTASSPEVPAGQIARPPKATTVGKSPKGNTICAGNAGAGSAAAYRSDDVEQ